MKLISHIIYITVLLLTGCTHTEHWEKTGGNQQSFDLDSETLEVLTEMDLSLGMKLDGFVPPAEDTEEGE